MTETLSVWTMLLWFLEGATAVTIGFIIVFLVAWILAKLGVLKVVKKMLYDIYE